MRCLQSWSMLVRPRHSPHATPLAGRQNYGTPQTSQLANAAADILKHEYILQVKCWRTTTCLYLMNVVERLLAFKMSTEAL